MKVTCPGKTILAGEHTVVYGYPAIAVSLGLHVSLDIELVDSNVITFTSQDQVFYQGTWDDAERKAKSAKNEWEIFEKTGDIAPLRDTVTSLADLLLLATGESLPYLTTTAKQQGFTAIIDSAIPLGRGFGSSSACAAVIASGLLSLFNRTFSYDVVYKITQECEKRIHGKPSGIDARTTVFGGCVTFANGAGESVRLPKSTLLPKLTLVDAGRPKQTTGELVSAVRQYKIENEELFQQYAEAVSSCVAATNQALLTDDATLFHNSMLVNQGLLERFPIVAPDVQEFCKAIRDVGGAAKISGAGGISINAGGLVLVFGLEREEIEKLAQQYTFSCFLPIDFGVQGVHHV